MPHSILKNKSVFFGFLVGLTLFLTCSYSALVLYQLGGIQDNIILGADTNERSESWAYGYGEHNFIHPNLSHFVNSVVRIVATVLSPAFPDLTKMVLQMRLALLVTPLCAMLTTCMVYLIALTAGVRVLPALALSLIYGFSISTIAYGSVPDHFMISALLLASGLYLLLLNTRLSDRNHIIAWTILAVFTVGITSSNIVPIIGMFAISEYKRKQPKAIDMIARVGLIFVRVGVLTIFLWACFNWIYHGSIISTGHNYGKELEKRTLSSISVSPIRDAIGFPFIVGQAFFGGAPDIVRYIPDEPHSKLARYEIMVVYPSPLTPFNQTSLLWLIPGLIIGVSLFLGFTAESGKFKPLTMAVILIIMFNWLLHSFWGRELFLYSPHWHFASVVGLIPLIRLLPTGRGTEILIVLLSTSLVVMNYELWNDILHKIPSFAAY